MNALVLALVVLPGGATSGAFDCTDALPRVMGADFNDVPRRCEVVACPRELRPHLGTWRGSQELLPWREPAEVTPLELRYLYCVVSDLEPTVYLYGLEGRPGGGKYAIARSEAARRKSYGHLVWGKNTPGCEPPNIYTERHERITRSGLGPVLEVEVRESIRESTPHKRVIARARLMKVD